MKFIPHFCVVLNAVIWGLVWIPMQWLDSKGLSVIWATFFSYLALSGLLLFARPSLLLNTLQSKTLLLMGIAYGLTNICFNWAVTNGDVVRVVFLFYLMPIWAAIFAKIFLSEDLGYKGSIQEIKYYFGIRTCYCNPEDDFKYEGSPKANAFLFYLHLDQ